MTLAPSELTTFTGTFPLVPLDPLLSCAEASVKIACSVASRDGHCRYCWVPQIHCFCHRLELELGLGLELESKSRPIGTAVESGANAAVAVATETGVTEVAGVNGVNSGAGVARANVGAESSSKRKRRRRPLRWVVLSHPNEFLRSTSSAKVAVQLLGGGSGSSSGSSDDVGDGGGTADTAELLVYGAECHRARFESIVKGHAGPTCILFPGNEPCLNVTEAMAMGCSGGGVAGGGSSGDDGNIGGEGDTEIDVNQVGDAFPLNEVPLNEVPLNKVPLNEVPLNELPLTVLVPDGSWECTHALVREIRRFATGAAADNGGGSAGSGGDGGGGGSGDGSSGDGRDGRGGGDGGGGHSVPPMPPRIPCVRLNDDHVASRLSPLIEALKRGQGQVFEAKTMPKPAPKPEPEPEPEPKPKTQPKPKPKLEPDFEPNLALTVTLAPVITLTYP